MPRLAVQQTVKSEVTLKPQVQKKLLTTLKDYTELNSVVKEYTNVMADHRKTILDITAKEVGESFELEGFRVAYVDKAETNKLDTVKLMKLLVGEGYSTKVVQDWFNKCNKRTQTKPYVKVTLPGDKD